MNSKLKYSHVFGGNESHKAPQHAINKNISIFTGTFPEGTLPLHELQVAELSIMAYDTPKLLLSDPVIFYDTSPPPAQDLLRQAAMPAEAPRQVTGPSRKPHQPGQGCLPEAEAAGRPG